MNEQLISQSFLGPQSDAILAAATIGVVGGGGGGSHIGQQAAHVGIGNFVVADFDRIERKNLNRLVGGRDADVPLKMLKVDVAERLIMSVNPAARVVKRPSRWQDCLEDLRACDIIVGCVDTFAQRNDLERFCRRFLIPYIDLGMDVHKLAEGYSISGQVVLSSPGQPCLWCLGILTEQRLAQEAKDYGAAGSHPQVIWANGVLASIGMGLAVQLLTPWHPNPVAFACCEFDGNNNRVETTRADYLQRHSCPHHPPTEVGDAFYRIS